MQFRIEWMNANQCCNSPTQQGNRIESFRQKQKIQKTNVNEISTFTTFSCNEKIRIIISSCPSDYRYFALGREINVLF